LTYGNDQMSAAQAMRAMGGFDVAEIEDVAGRGGLVVIAPHPDDESLGCGGLISLACAQGRSLKVIVVSDGSGSHPRSRAYSRTRLRALRENEARRAVSALGLAPRHVDFLRLRDRFVPSAGPAARVAVERIVAAARGIDATALFVSWRHDPHCDHQAAYLLARAAQRELGSRLYEYSIWGAALGVSTPVTPATAGFRLKIGRTRALKRRAIAMHESQVSNIITDDPIGFRLSAKDLVRLSGPFEAYVASDK
jgi:LmbE family N-acetylglucosaminyl deacetylase